uniref:Protein FMC1 homolog n=1 Tax=Eptatretus burgeri TaxID=7764 RepID=A0A8C4QJB7_EPTBU
MIFKWQKFLCHHLMVSILLCQVTEKRQCRGHREALHCAEAFLCLLRSQRRLLELQMARSIHRCGESNTEQAARMVGLMLPQRPTGSDDKGWQF